MTSDSHNEVVCKLGGVSDDSWSNDLVSRWTQIVERVRTRPELKWTRQLPVIRCFVIKNQDVNAFACAVADGYAIGVYDGLRLTLLKTYSTLLSDPRAFPAIGNIDEETISDIADRFVFSDLPDALEYSRTPKCAERLEFAKHMTELSLRFAFYHELFHVLLGHVDLFSAATPLFELGIGSIESKVTRHAIEFHADEHAFQSCFSWIVESMIGEEIQDPATFFVNTVHGQLLDLFCAAYVLFHVFRVEESSSHPSPVVRQIRIAIILNYLVRVSKIPCDEPPVEIAHTVCSNVDLYMQEILGIPWTERQEMTNKTFMNAKELIGPYSEAVRRLYPQLNSVSYIFVE